LPDIDLDLPSGDEREKAIQYTYRHLSREFPMARRRVSFTVTPHRKYTQKKTQKTDGRPVWVGDRRATEA
jgi:hypothetical protein